MINLLTSAIISEGLAQWHLPAPETALSGFDRFADLLAEKNKTVNLTAITGREDMARLHFLDCLSLFQTTPLSGARLIDIGAGAGFPSIVLSLYDPSIIITALDSAGKRVSFLREAAAALALDSFTCIKARAEEQARLPAYREGFDFAVSRAVANMAVLCELCLPFVKVGGAFLAMKSDACDEEVAAAQSAIAQLGGAVEPAFSYRIPGTDIVRRIVIVRKVKQTPAQFPRRFAKISKVPL